MHGKDQSIRKTREEEEIAPAGISESQNRNDEKSLLVSLADGDQVSQGEILEESIEIRGSNNHAGKELRESVPNESPRISKSARIEKRKNA